MRLLGKRGVGIRTVQVAAEAEADLQLATARAASMQAIVSRPAVVGSCTPKCDSQPFEDGVLELRRDADRADPLHVRVPADRHQPGARPADHAAQQRQIANRLHVLHAVGVVRDAHRPAEDDVLGLRVALGDRVDLGQRARRSST